MNTKTLILLICLFAMSQQHGVHRVAQSMWNYPNFGATTKLYLYFSLDEALPAGGLMNIALPTAMATAFIPTTCNAWAITKTLAPPATTSGFMMGSIVSVTGCQFYTYSSTATNKIGAAVGLDANTAYGIELYMSGGGALPIGSYAPISITTRSGHDGTIVFSGPMLGCNPAFDMVFVSAAPLGFTTTVTRVADITTPAASACVALACNSKKDQPTDVAQYIFSIGAWSGYTTATVIPAPYDIQFSFTKTTSSTAGFVYGTWTFSTLPTSCTSIQFGPANSTGLFPTMNTVKPVCAYAANSDNLFVKTISVTDVKDGMTPVSGAWTTWTVSFQMDVTNPADNLYDSPTLTTRIVHPTKNLIFAQSINDATTVFAVVIGTRTSTSFDVVGDSIARVAFGANPMISTGHLYGAGVYAETYCVGSADYNNNQKKTGGATATTDNVATLPSNCAATTADNINAPDQYTAAGPQPARSVNAIELAWTIPLAIPADTTTAVVECTTDKTFQTENAKFRFFHIHQSSLVTDVAKGNCWYSSTNKDDADFFQKEVVTCTDLGKIASNDILTIAFQFEIFQRPYIAYGNGYANSGAQISYASLYGRNKKWSKGRVVKTIKTLTCQMKINTAGSKTWYTQSIVIPVDGSVVANHDTDFAQYQTFISQIPSTLGITYAKAFGKWVTTGVAAGKYAAGSITHSWQTEPVIGAAGEFGQDSTGTQNLVIALMFYIGDAYTTESTAWTGDLMAGRKIPMAISGVMNLKFYLYSSHTFTGSNKLQSEWQGYSGGTAAAPTITDLFRWTTGNEYVATIGAFYFGAYTDATTTTGGLDICADSGWDAATGLCKSTALFTTTDVSKEGGKVLIHSTSKAGGHATVAAASAYLSKACITNGGTVPTVATTGYTHIQNLFTSCAIDKTKYPAQVGLDASAWSSGTFYVMFSGALHGTVATDANKGFISANFVFDSTNKAYEKMNFATFYKFEYTAAYKRNDDKWMTTFRGRGGVGSSAKQGLETNFWSLKDNGTSITNTWVIATMIHTYIAPATTVIDYAASAAKVVVSWPSWVDGLVTALTPVDEQNNGLLFFNTMKITVLDGYGKLTIFATNNAYIGTFVPRGQAFMKSTGDNEIEVVSTATTTKCYLYGSLTGESYGVLHVSADAASDIRGHQLIAAGSFRIHKHGYALDVQLDTNFMVCSIGTVTSTGVVTVIPFTQYYASATTKLTSELAGLVAATWAWKVTLVIGSDRFMHMAYWYPEGTAIVADTDYISEKDINQFFTSASDLSLIATTTLTAFEVDGLVHTEFIIGATGVNAKISCTLGGTTPPSSQNWLSSKLDLAQICGDPTYLMGANAGDVNSGIKLETTVDKLCLKHTQAVKPEGVTLTTTRECWFCPIEAGTTMTWIIKSFTVPVTQTRVVNGFTTVITTSTGITSGANVGNWIKAYNSPGTITTGQVLSNIGTITQCGVSPASVSYSVLGSTVAWSVTSPTPLAGGWIVRFVGDKTTAGFFAVTPVAGSLTTTCGSVDYYTSATTGVPGRTFSTVGGNAQDMTVVTASMSYVQFLLPAVAGLDATTTAVALPNTYAAACAGKSKFTATVNNWIPTGTATKIAAGNCVITIAASAAEVTGSTDTLLGAISKTAGLAFDQSVVGVASTLGLTGIKFTPRVSASYGRFRFVPSMGTGPALYAGQSTFTYTFGSATFATGAVCKITDSLFAKAYTGVSSCIATGSQVTIKMGISTASAQFGVEIFGVTASWAQTAQLIETGLSNFGTSVQTHALLLDQSKLEVLPATQTVKPTLVLAKTYVNTMDLGTFNFTATLATVGGTFNSSQWAMIQFPTYYRADLGAGVLCSVQNLTEPTATESVWCELQWDYTLKVWGPIANPMMTGKAFAILVMGVDNVNPSAARLFQVGFSAMSTTNVGSSLTVDEDNCFMEFMTVTDTVVATGWAAAKTSLKVWTYTSSSANTRGTTEVKIMFQVPTTTLATIKDITLGYVTLHLPKMWGAVIKGSTALTTKLEEQSKDTPYAFSEIGATKPATFSGCSVTVWMTGTTNSFKEGANYTLTVGGIPTSQSAVENSGLMYPVVSVGKQTTGGLGWSDSMGNWEPTTNPTFAVAKGLKEVMFSLTSYKVNQGTFTDGLCIMPSKTGDKFNSDISFAIDGTTFVTAPATLTAKQGDLSTCASIGTASTTALSWYWVTFTAVSTKYTALPNLKVMVENNKGTINNVNEAACTLGYSSVPIKVSYSTAPFKDVIVSLNAKALAYPALSADNHTNNPSFGMTANTGAGSVTLTQLVPSGILSFTCSAAMNVSTPSQLWYNLTGTDAASFKLQNMDVKATGLLNRTAQLTAPVLVLTQNNATGSAAMTNLNVACPEVGTAYVWFAPSGTTAPTAATGAAVKSLADAFLTSTEVAGYDSKKAHKAEQWFQVPIITTNSPPVAADYKQASFHTVSNKTMTSMLYCFTSTEWFYALPTAFDLTSKDNGGKVSNIELTYNTYFDEALNNDDLLKVAGALATGVMISNDRVSDRWGGISGKPSQFVPKTAQNPQTAVVATANATNATNATNTTTAAATTTTRLLATTYPVNLFIQPDPTAAVALDSTAWTAAIVLAKDDISAAVTTYGSVQAITASAAAPSITEAPVAFSTDPAHASNADGSSVDIAGAVAGDAYVYCAFQKVGTAAAVTTRRILQNATATNATATNATATPAATTPTTAAVATSMLSWSESSWTLSYNFMRSTTSTAVPAFTQSFNTTGGSTYKWACQGTSLNPVAANAQFMTAYKEDSVTATVAVVTGAGSLFSTIAAISFIIIAAFFY